VKLNRRKPVCAGPKPVPVLRAAPSDDGVEPGPRDSAVAGRDERVGQHRVRMRALQRQEGRAYAEQARMKLIALPKRPRRSPVLTIKLSDSRYASWKQFLDFAYWNVELK